MKPGSARVESDREIRWHSAGARLHKFNSADDAQIVGLLRDQLFEPCVRLLVYVQCDFDVAPPGGPGAVGLSSRVGLEHLDVSRAVEDGVEEAGLAGVSEVCGSPVEAS